MAQTYAQAALGVDSGDDLLMEKPVLPDRRPNDGNPQIVGPQNPTPPTARL